MPHKDNLLVENVKNTIAALLLRKNNFVCCTRDSGAPPPTTPEEPLRNSVDPLKQIFTKYLNINESNGDTIEEGIYYTYKEGRQVSKQMSVTRSTVYYIVQFYTCVIILFFTKKSTGSQSVPRRSSMSGATEWVT